MSSTLLTDAADSTTAKQEPLPLLVSCSKTQLTSLKFTTTAAAATIAAAAAIAAAAVLL
jgi:hypothetical protein